MSLDALIPDRVANAKRRTLTNFSQSQLIRSNMNWQIVLHAVSGYLLRFVAPRSAARLRSITIKSGISEILFPPHQPRLPPMVS